MPPKPVAKASQKTKNESSKASKGHGKGQSQTPAILMQGVLEKKSKMLGLDRWQSRWFVLKADSLLYLKSKEEPENAAKKFAIEEISQASPHQDIEMVIEVESRRLELRAKTAEERRDWIKSIQGAISVHTTRDFKSFAALASQGETVTSHWKETLAPSVIEGKTRKFAICKVFKGDEEWKDIEDRFAASSPRESLVRINRIQNKDLILAFRNYKENLSNHLQQDHSPKLVRSQVVWHGCKSAINAISIADFGFQAVGSRGGIDQYGKGCYFAADSALAARYAGTVDKQLAILLAESPERLIGLKFVLLGYLAVGDWSVGRHDVAEAPVIPDSKTQRRFDTMVDKEENPQILVSTATEQAYPAYIVCYKDCA